MAVMPIRSPPQSRCIRLSAGWRTRGLPCRRSSRGRGRFDSCICASQPPRSSRLQQDPTQHRAERFRELDVDGGLLVERAGPAVGLVDDLVGDDQVARAGTPRAGCRPRRDAMMCVQPSCLRAKMFARYGTCDGLSRWPGPWRDRKKTGTPDQLVSTIASLGLPNGVSSSCQRPSGRHRAQRLAQARPADQSDPDFTHARQGIRRGWAGEGGSPLRGGGRRIDREGMPSPGSPQTRHAAAKGSAGGVEAAIAGSGWTSSSDVDASAGGAVGVSAVISTSVGRSSASGTWAGPGSVAPDRCPARSSSRH